MSFTNAQGHNFLSKDDYGSSVHIVSFYQQNIARVLVDYQKKVFDKFEVPLNQVLTEIHDHGAAIDDYMSAKPGWQFLILFDIDCIPLHASFLAQIFNYIAQGDTLFGVAQQAQHYPHRHVYAGPACMGLSRQLYESLGCPSFTATSRGDVGEELTYLAEENGYQVKLLWPTSVYEPKWPLGSDRVFGIGTTYDNVVFHSFQARNNLKSVMLFIRTCRRVLGQSRPYCVRTLGYAAWFVLNNTGVRLVRSLGRKIKLLAAR